MTPHEVSDKGKVGFGRDKVKRTICLIKNLDENGLLPQGKTYTN